MKVANFYSNEANEVVALSKALQAPQNYISTFVEVPLKIGEFNPVVCLKVNSELSTNISPNWLYVPKDIEQRAAEHPDLEGDFDGPLPMESMLIKRAPFWVVAGIQYSREVYALLLSLPREAHEGLAAMQKSHPAGFVSLEKASVLSPQAKKRFAIAQLTAKWDAMQRLGLPVTLQQKIDEFARAAGEKVTTLKQINSIKQRIIRAAKRR